MSIDAARGLLACPHCGASLSPHDGRAASVSERVETRSVGRVASASERVETTPTAFHCPAGHTFDVARQGYLNLLGGPQPANADAPAMVDARARVLASGLFDPVAAEVARRVAGIGILGEVGAGTGWYLARALDANPSARGVAFDVSVAAAKRAARCHERAASVVADVWAGLPLLPRRLGALLCVFAPRNMAEFARVLAHRGLLVVVTPNDTHLSGLRERYGLLDVDPDKAERLRRSALDLFSPVASTRLEYTRPLGSEGVRDLIAMGPNAFHGVPDDVADAEVAVSVTVHLFRNATGG